MKGSWSLWVQKAEQNIAKFMAKAAADPIKAFEEVMPATKLDEIRSILDDATRAGSRPFFLFFVRVGVP